MVPIGGDRPDVRGEKTFDGCTRQTSVHKPTVESRAETMCRFFLHRLVAVLVTGLLVAPTAFGQSAASDSLHLALTEGVRAVEQGEGERAVELLEPVFTDAPSYIDSEHGSVTYWLGRALAEQDQHHRARGVLRSGVIMMNKKEQFDPRLADAFIHRVFAEQDSANFDLATEGYQELLRQIGADAIPRAAEEKRIIADHLRHLTLVLPEEVARRAGLPSEPENISTEHATSVEGSILLKWWRSQDSRPATTANERLRTHLRRLAHVQREYAHPDASPFDFDERGEIYLRLGAPDETAEVNFNEPRLTEMITKPGGVQVDLSAFHENEFWSYGDVDQRTYYIFVEKKRGEPFTIGTVEDMLPRKLRRGFSLGQSGPSAAVDPRRSRGLDRSMKMLASLRAIYRKYVPLHPDMATRHDRVANYIANWQMEQGEMSRTQRRPDEFARQSISDARNQDQIAAMHRKENTPQELGAKKRAETLDIAVRTARFLNEDGTTRTDVYWAPEAQALVPGENQLERFEDEKYNFNEYLLQFTAVQKTPDYRNRAAERERLRITGVTESGGMTIPAQSYSTEQGDSTLYHLGLQWDQYLINYKKNKLGPKIKVATTQQDSLRPLDRDESTLEMSDLKPIVFPDGKPDPEEALAYPFRDINPKTQLGFYFEIYSLPFNADGQTEYTVAYEVRGHKERGAITGTLLGENGKRTTVETTRQGGSRTAKEYILLDLGDWEGEKGSSLDVTVRVKDETSEMEVERDIEFDLVAPLSE